MTHIIQLGFSNMCQILLWNMLTVAMCLALSESCPLAYRQTPSVQFASLHCMMRWCNLKSIFHWFKRFDCNNTMLLFNEQSLLIKRVPTIVWVLRECCCSLSFHFCKMHKTTHLIFYTHSSSTTSCSSIFFILFVSPQCALKKWVWLMVLGVIEDWSWLMFDTDPLSK